MEKLELEVYSRASNSAVIKPPGRQFPGIVIQGDSLSILYGEALEVLRALHNTGDKEAYYAALSLAEKLEDHLTHYIQVLQQHNISTPFVRRSGESVATYRRQDDDL
jgi:hypothetical protein